MGNPVTLTDLIATTTQADALSVMLSMLQLGNFPVSSWQSGSVPQALLNAEAINYADAMNVVAALAAGGYVDLAAGDWLTLLAHNVYQLDRKTPQFAQGPAILTDASGAGPFTILPNQVWAISLSGQRFNNITGGTLPLNGTLPLTWQAESADAAHNIPINTLTKLVTALPGVTINNPGNGSTWLTQVGADPESDDSLRIRCRARWPGLGGGATALVYQGWALTASSEVTKVKVLEATPVPGKVTVTVAGAAGPVSSGAVTDVQNYINPRRPLCVDVIVQNASPLTIAIGATIYVKAAYQPSAQGSALTNLAALQNALGIGDTLYRAAIIDQIMNVQGAVNTTVTTPSTDVTMANNQIAVLTPSIVVVSV